MKKYLMTLAAVFFCAMTTTMSTACTDDNGSIIPAATVQAVKVVYDVALVGDSENYKSFTNYVNTRVEYLDESGLTKSEIVSGLTWTKTIVLKNFPARTSLKVQYIPNGNSPTEKAVHVGIAWDISYDVIMSDGKPYGGRSSSSFSGESSIPSDMLQAWIDKQNARAAITYTYKLNSDKTEVTEE